MRLDHLLSKETRSKEQNPKVKGNKLLFNFEGLRTFKMGKKRKIFPSRLKIWGCSSAGRAPALHAGGQEFDPPHLHQKAERKSAESDSKWANSSAG